MSVAEKSFGSVDSKSLTFNSYGVIIEIKATRSEHIDLISKRIETALPNNFEITEDLEPVHRFFIENTNDSFFTLYLNDSKVTAGDSERNFFNFLESKIRLTVAEFATKKVFLHSGVVSVNGKAILIPASSFKGKSTLVKELIKKGAEYFSDEFAVLDENGLVHPFPKTLSIREIGGNSEQIEYTAESFGAKIAIEPSPVGMILITEYQEDAVWDPKVISNGEAILELVQHTIPIRSNTRFALHVLNKVVSRAIICKSVRGEVGIATNKILDYFETNI